MAICRALIGHLQLVFSQKYSLSTLSQRALVATLLQGIDFQLEQCVASYGVRKVMAGVGNGEKLGARRVYP